MPRDLTNEEIAAFQPFVSQSKLKEITGLQSLGCFERKTRRDCCNIIDSRWVTTWNLIGDTVVIKSRLAARGLKDPQ